jgi:hypothetical protein
MGLVTDDLCMLAWTVYGLVAVASFDVFEA